jgi:hypothetical protein
LCTGTFVSQLLEKLEFSFDRTKHGRNRLFEIKVSGHFLEVVIVDFSSAGRHQENFGRTSTKNAQAAKSANAHCNFGAPRALRRSLSVIHSRRYLTSRPRLTG